ncbi:hypothetical protein [Chondromyces apiculatus]|uniref:hypothetical protein n=1 Tax=Chondromyces apiculatus TaxID=51 RepID=UPI001E59FB87|nr:hypothetical protein [Chondromyces apiculatus]
MVSPAWVIDPDDPRAPPEEIWDALSPRKRPHASVGLACRLERMRTLTTFVVLATVGLAGLLLQACGSDASGGGGGAGGAGGSSGTCGLFGPQNPDGCSIEGFSCYYADTSCSLSWVCQSGQWESTDRCFGPGGGGGQGGAGAGGAGQGGAGAGGAGQGGAGGSGSGR